MVCSPAMLAAGRLLLPASLLVILALTLAPFPGRPVLGWSICLFCGVQFTSLTLLNVALFVPFGAALGARGVAIARAVGLGFALSLAVEFSQSFIPGRASTLGDLLWNTTGAALGAWLAWHGARWAPPSRPRAAAAAGLVVACWLATGFLLRPTLPDLPYYGGWTPEQGNREHYQGTVLDARLGDGPLGQGELPDSDRVRAALARHAALVVRLEVGPPPARLAPILGIYDDAHHEILLLAARGRRLVLARYSTGSAWGFDQPYLRLDDAFAGVAPGEVIEIRVEPVSGGTCLTLGARRTCRLGFHVGDGWAVLKSPRFVPDELRSSLGILWLAALCLPVGFWLRRRGDAAAAAVALSALAAALPVLTPLVATPPLEILAPALGVAAGHALGRNVSPAPPDTGR